MGRYPKFKRVRQDLLKSAELQPVGAFASGGKITAGWKGVSSGAPTFNGRLAAMCASAVGGGILAATEDGKIYTGSLGAGLTLAHSDGGSSPFVFETQDTAPRAVLLSGNTFTTLQSGSILHGEFPVKLSCGTMRRGRLFGADAENPYVLRWSGSKGFNDWISGISGAGSLTLEPFGGHVLDIFDFEDRLVVIREGSIMRFSVYGNPENFKEVDTAISPQIYRSTAAISGDGILFFTSGGLMSYRGGKIAKIDGLISDDLQSPTSAFVYDGRYYFICGTSKSLSKSVVYVYDFLHGGYEIIDIPAYFISHDGTSLVAYAPSAIYRLRWGYEYILYEVATESMDFGTDRRKLLTELEVDCDEDVRVSISNGRSTKTIRSAKGRTRLNMRGADFKVTFSGYGGSVRSAYLTAEVTE